MEASVPKVHLQVSFLDQAIYLPRKSVSVDAINRVLVKSTDIENGKLQEEIEPFHIFISKRGVIKISTNLKWVEK